MDMVQMERLLECQKLEPMAYCLQTTSTTPTQPVGMIFIQLLTILHPTHIQGFNWGECYLFSTRCI